MANIIVGIIAAAFALIFVATTRALPAESDGLSPHHRAQIFQLFSRANVSTCATADGPEEQTTLLARLFADSESQFSQSINHTFDDMDVNHDGQLGPGEIHKLDSEIPTADPNVNITLSDLPRMTDTNDDKLISRDEFYTGANILVHLPFRGCSQLCASVETKLRDTCSFFAPSVDPVRVHMQKQASFQSTACRVGSDVFDTFAKCVKRVTCDQLPNCFVNAIPHTVCQSEDSSNCKTFQGYYNRLADIAITVKKASHAKASNSSSSGNNNTTTTSTTDLFATDEESLKAYRGWHAAYLAGFFIAIPVAAVFVALAVLFALFSMISAVASFMAIGAWFSSVNAVIFTVIAVVSACKLFTGPDAVGLVGPTAFEHS